VDLTLRPFGRAEFDAAAAVIELAFFMSGRPEDRERFAAALEFERTLGAFAGAQIVGTAGVYSFRLTVPGAVVPAAGVTVVTVHPAHRRRGILSAMMGHQLTGLQEGGEPIAALRASEASIYGRFGYAPATRELTIECPRSAAPFGPDAPVAEVSTELHPAADVGDRLAELYESVRPGTPGFIGRNDVAWTEVLHDPEDRRGGATAQRALLASVGGAPRGYVLYRVRGHWPDGVPAGTVEVSELVAAEPAVAVALWRHVLDLDLTATVAIAGRPPDDPLLWLLTDPRRARARVRDGLWVRLVRLGEALAARRYAAPVDLVLDVTDARCPWNARRWRLAGDAGSASCEPTSDAADLRIDTTALAAGYLGDPVLGAYAGAGRVLEHRAGALGRLAAAMAWTPGPWCTHHF
jgi:predicted acetyltransferase